MSPAPRTREPLPLAVLGRATDLCVVVAGTLIVVLMFGNVTSRFVFNFDVAWSTELIGFLMIWATFLGGAAATRRRAHMRVAEFVSLAKGRTRRVFEFVINALVALMLVYLTWYGWLIAAGNMDQLSTVLYYPIGLQYAALPVGSALALLYVLRDLVQIAATSVPEDDSEI